MSAPVAPRTPVATAPSDTAPWTARDVAGPSVLVLLLYAGYIKANPLLADLPVDLTLLALVGVLVGVAGVVLARGADVLLPAGAVAVLLCAVPGVLLASANPYATDKVSKLALTAVAGLAPLFLVTTARRRSVFVWAHVAVGGVLAVGALLTPARESETIRLASEGADTIATGRALGVAAVVLIVLAIAAPRVSMTGRLVALVGAAVLAYFLVGTGSRGPLLAVAAAIVVVTVAMPGRGRLLRACVVVGGLLVPLWLLVVDSGQEGASRIRDTLSGRASSGELRFAIWHDALVAVRDHPLGVGWGDFWTVLSPGARHTPSYTQYAHDVVLESTVEGGWLAGAAVVVVIVAGLALLVRGARRHGAHALLAIGVFVVVNALVSGDVNDNRTMWAVLAVGWAAGWARDAGNDARVVRDFP